MSYENEMENEKATNRGLWRALWLNGAIMVSLVVLLFWTNRAHDLRISPKTFHQGGDIVTGEYPIENLYNDAWLIFQQIMFWKDDGEKDYIANIQKYSNFLTPSCRDFLNADYDKRLRNEHGVNELRDRRRSINLIPESIFNPRAHTPLGRNSWVIRYDTYLNEDWKDGVPIKENLPIRYSLNVTWTDIDRNSNPWGVLINCYAQPPVEVDPVTFQTVVENQQ